MTGGSSQIEFCRVSLVEFGDVSCELYGHDLHAQAYAEVGYVIFSAKLCRLDFPLPSAFTKAAWNQVSVAFCDRFVEFSVDQYLVGFKTFDVYAVALRYCCVVEGFH